jgi:two-component system, cell cycle sensor histidine kinase and response regulator CckA
MALPLNVLIIEDLEDDAVLLTRVLRKGGFEPLVARVEAEQAMREALALRKWDIIISDYSLPSFDAPRALATLKDSGQDIPFLVVSGCVDESTIIEAMKAGADDYLMKENLSRLVPAVHRELRQSDARRQRRRLEEQFRQAQKMEAVGRLAGGVAHDFNNLLTIITGYSELLLSRNQLSESDRTALDEIRRAAERGGSLTHQLLAFSRRQPLRPRVASMNDLIANMNKMLQRLIGEDIQLATIPSKHAGSVKIDPGQFEQVLMNIVINARDAMPRGGNLTIETAEVFINTDRARSYVDLQAGHYVLLSVTDSGKGMDAETRSHLFEPFFTTKEPGKGTGLGLATVYGIVKQSGGFIEVASAPGQGTNVQIYLPQAEPSTEEEPAAVSQTVSLDGSETILLVEDEPCVRAIICEILRPRGYRVLECTSGAEALQTARNFTGPIDLILTDVVMPELSGPELVRVLLGERPGTRVLYISGYTDEATVLHGLQRSDVDFLQKPFVPNELAGKIRQALQAPHESRAGC